MWCDTGYVFICNQHILSMFDVRTWWEAPKTQSLSSCSHCAMTSKCCFLSRSSFSGKWNTFTLPHLVSLYTLEEVKLMLDSENSFWQAASKRRQRYRYLNMWENWQQAHTLYNRAQSKNSWYFFSDIEFLQLCATCTAKILLSLSSFSLPLWINISTLQTEALRLSV